MVLTERKEKLFWLALVPSLQCADKYHTFDSVTILGLPQS